MEAIQRRVSDTTAMVGSMKEIKMLGLVDVCSHLMQNLLENEMTRSIAFRRMLSVLNAAGMVRDTMIRNSEGLQSYRQNTRKFCASNYVRGSHPLQQWHETVYFRSFHLDEYPVIDSGTTDNAGALVPLCHGSRAVL